MTALRASAFLQTGGTPQVASAARDNNAHFAWVQRFIHHLAPATTGTAGGMAGFVLANGSMSSTVLTVLTVLTARPSRRPAVPSKIPRATRHPL
jgi:hypothetical protein